MRHSCVHAIALCIVLVDSVICKSIDQGPRASVHIHVSIHLFSGRPNPTWRISDSHEDYRHHLDMMQTLPSKTLPNHLGYQGFTLKHVLGDELGTILNTTVTSYPEWELSLLESIDIDPGMKAHVRKEIILREHSRSRRYSDPYLGYEPDTLLYRRPTLENLFMQLSPTERLRFAKMLEKKYGVKYNETTSVSLGPTRFEPEKWNHFPVLETNNCYNYANNEITYTIAQPGKKHSCSYSSIYPTGREIMKDAECDGLKPLKAPSANALPAHGLNLVALVFWPVDEDGMYDFHWYRMDINKHWSHKPGKTNATNVDNSGRTITDPRHADRGHYTEFVSFMETRPDKVKIE